MDYRDEYKKIAEQHHFEYSDERSEVTFCWSDNGNKVRTEFCHLKKDNISFFAYDMFAPTTYMNNTYCGVYSVFNCNDEQAECDILRKGESLLNFIIYNSGDKIGDKFIDKNLYIKAKNINALSRYITKEITDEYMKLWDTSDVLPIKIVIGKGSDVLPSIPFYNDKMVVGLTLNSTWVEPCNLIKMIDQFSGFIIKINC